MPLHTITSEILTENENTYVKLRNGNAISKFVFKCPSYMLKSDLDKCSLKYDDDDDLDVNRQKEETLLIEHRMSTELRHVGLQIWRGALLLADYILSNPNLFRDKVVLELGAGVGLTSIVASFLAREVICTDVNVEDMLKLIQRNSMRNTAYTKSHFYVRELNFLNLQWPAHIKRRLASVNIILAADVIYDATITDGFVRTLAKLLDSEIPKMAYVALEKRYVFTIADMDTTAPMYEEFLHCISKHNLHWNVEYIKLDFPQYFKYDRVKHMILMKIENKLNRSAVC